MSTPLVAVSHVSRSFGGGHTRVDALRDVSFTVDPGEVVLIMGPSGSGKTTLLTIIGGLLRPSAGSVAIDGTDIVGLSRRELARVRRQLVGFVFQSFNLLDGLTAQENVEIALNVAGIRGRAAAARAYELLADAGLGQRSALRAWDLSSGEKQRVALARALANRPRLLLADEPTANLDSSRGHEVGELLRRLGAQEGTGVVIVSHDERLEGICDRVLRLEDGSLRAPELESGKARTSGPGSPRCA